MKKNLATLISIGTLIVTLFLFGCATPSSGSRTDTTAAAPKAHCEFCASKKAAGEDYWCSSCNKGMVQGKSTPCEGCVQEAKTGSHDNYEHVE